ncbi:MAG: STAS domain-containing protein [Halopseudomonas yangmingensis]|uniref:Phospholipid transport system transporter-binding protein n=1 Tax=Halopseudomonas yangmingensis TaxID=1720063 RepID=A0A1I4N4D0_9GAMM|nr:STAS domain-containing protein [Halopseudomonas yangmingensis]SFM10123.1 phospholipid transport system transporter-binding protein [Halopseudomonas yangmingensis]
MEARLVDSSDGRICLEGVLDFSTAAALHDQLLDALRRGSGNVELDLSGVQHSNSVGLSLILLAARELATLGRQLSVASLPEGLHSMAGVCGLDDWLSGLAGSARQP